MAQTSPQNDLKRFTYSKTFIVGFGFLGISIIWPIFNQFIPIFLQAGNPEFERQLLEAGREIPKVVGFGLAPSLALFIMTWDNIINVFIQPWVGAKSDHTWNRFGRRKPWILLGHAYCRSWLHHDSLCPVCFDGGGVHPHYQFWYGAVPLADRCLAG